MTSPPETHIIRLTCPIRGQATAISDAEVRAALGATVPIGTGLHIAFDADPPRWQRAQQRIAAEVGAFLAGPVASSPVKHLSVFAIAPIPLLMALGRVLGETMPVTVYNHHRDPAGWSWRGQAPEGGSVSLRPMPTRRTAQAAVVLLSVSGAIDESHIDACVSPRGRVLYEIRAEEPRANLLQTAHQLSTFRDCWRRVLAHLHDHYRDCPVHLFAALPPAAAVAVGQVVMPGHGESVHAYRWHGQGAGFRYALALEGAPLSLVDPTPLADFLRDAFNPAELRAWLVSFPGGKDILDGLPRDASLVVACSEAAGALVAEPELLRAALAELREMRSTRVQEIYALGLD